MSMTEGKVESWRMGVEVPPASVTVFFPLRPPQAKGFVPDWSIVLITVTVVAAIVSLLYGIKMVSEAVV